MNAKLLVYSYKSCSTCRKAIKWLEEHNLQYELIDIVNNPPDEDTIRIALEKIDNRKKLFNTSGVSYRAIGASIVNQMSNEEAIQALAKDGKLIKRPFAIYEGNIILLGFNQELWTKALLG